MQPTNSALLFDFDGVLVDSTKIKTDAYRELFKEYPADVVTKIVTHHQQHGGISRVDKIKHAHKAFIDHPYSEGTVTEHARKYSELVLEKVVEAEWIPGAEEFVKQHYQRIPLFIISGTPDNELKEVVRRRNMADYFKEILGSPKQKPEHIRWIVEHYGLETKNCFFIGDALTDYHAARDTGMPFIGIQGEVPFPEKTTVLANCTGLRETMVRFWEKI